MKRLLRWALRGRADEAVADLLDLFERRAATIGRTRARLRLVVDVLTVTAFGIRRAIGQLVSGLPGDLRCAVRVLRKAPSFTITGVLILALGIGANTAIFSIVNAMLLTPIPSASPEVVGIYWRDTTKPDDYRAFSYADYQNIRAARAPFNDVMAYTVTRVGVTKDDDTRMTFGMVTSANYFSVLQTRLALGREFTAEEERPGSDIRVVIVGHQYWQTAGGTTAVLGTTVRLNGQDYTVIGVAPEGFTGTMALLTPEFWLPTGVYDRVVYDFSGARDTREKLAAASTRALMLVGRFPRGLNAERAAPLLVALTTRFVEIDPSSNRQHALMVQKLPRMGMSTEPQTDGPVAGVSALLMGTASLVLLLACLNLANMLLARGTARRREIAVRVAIGGGRLRIVRQLLIESLLLAAIGGAAGLLLASFAIQLFMASARAAVPISLGFDGTPDIRVLGATIAFSVLSTLLAGLGPAWRASRPDLLTDLKDHPAMAGGFRRVSARNALVVAQVAVCLALLVAAGLFVRGAMEAAGANLGFATDRGIVLNVDPGLIGYTESQSRTVMARLMERLRATPGIESASFGSIVPFGDEHEGRPVARVGAPADAEAVNATYTIIGADYFATLGIPILQGRGFSAVEETSTDSTRVAVVDQALAARLFGDEPAVGQIIRFPREKDVNLTMQVVGVAGGVINSINELVPSPHVYIPHGRAFASGQYVHLRVRNGIEPVTLLDVVRQVVANVNVELPILRLKTLEQFRRGSLQVWVVASAARIFSSFGLVALVLAVAGVYGMKAYVVSRRTREIAIRLALGATPRGVLWMIVKEGLALTAAGLVAGIAAALGIARALSAILYGVSPSDPLVFASAIAVLGIAALVASYVPARRATKLAPSTALRAE